MDDLSEYVERVRIEWWRRFCGPKNGFELAEYAVEALATELAKARLADEVYRYMSGIDPQMSDETAAEWAVESWLARYDAIVGDAQGEDVSGALDA